MKKLILKGLALTISASMLFSMTSCSLFDKASKQVTEAAEAFCADLTEAKASKVFKQCNEMEDEDEEYYTDIFANEVDSNSKLVECLNAIQGTISYEVDSKSANASTKSEEGTIDVNFSIADYESVADEEDEWDDADDFIDALEDCEDRIEFTITFEFVKDGDDWLVDNYEDVFDDFFEYQDADIYFKMDYSSMVDYSDWYWSDGDGYVYYNTNEIELDLWFTDEGINAEWNGLSFEVSVNGVSTYTGTPDVFSMWLECTYYNETDQAYMPEGSYEITVYDSNHDVVYTSTCQVYIDESSTSYSSNDYSSDEGYLVDYTDWWCDDGCDVYGSVYTIELDVWKANWSDWTGCTFQVFDRNGTILYESEVDNYGGYVECIYSTDDYIPAGQYTITVYDPDGNTLASSTCTVES